MNYYSYDYVVSQISKANWLAAIFVGGLLVLTGLVSLRAYQDQKDSKYRELMLILVLTVFVTVLTMISSLQANEASDNRYRTSLRLIEFISDKLGVKSEEVYVNTSAVTDETLVYVKGYFYRALRGTEPHEYVLEIVDLYQPNIELVEVEE